MNLVARKAWTALAIAVLSVVVRLSSFSSSKVNGEMVSCSYTDFGGIALGGVAVLVAATAGAQGRRSAPTLVVSAIALVVGAAGLLKGFGVIWNPCAG